MNTDELLWRRAIPGELVTSREIHVWRSFIDLSTHQIENLAGILSPHELDRARGFNFERDRKHFIAARAILRKILGFYLGRNPQELCFEYTSYGKPVLATNGGYDILHFNLSHSDAFALCAVTRGGSIGVDIERLRDDVAIGQIAQRFFSKNEVSSLERIYKHKRSEVFFQYWTRKEAFLKAMGKGISFPMEHCDVSLMNGSSLSPVKLLGDNKESPCWYGQDLFPGDGYVAAVAVEGADWNISCLDYDFIWG